MTTLKVIGLSLNIMFLLNTSIAMETSTASQCQPIFATDEDAYDQNTKGFKFWEAYEIPRLHAGGLTGKGYTVSILEDSANVDHVALKEKLTLLNPLEGVDPERTLAEKLAIQTHGNHVSALIVGNKIMTKGNFTTDDKGIRVRDAEGKALREPDYKDFFGGIASDAQGFLLKKRGKPTTDLAIKAEEELTLFEEAAKRSHIINLSGSLGSWDIPPYNLSSKYINNLKEILEKHDAILIITASNSTGKIGKLNKLQYLIDLTKNPEIMKRILIIGNLGYLSEKSLEKIESNIKIWETDFFPKLDSFNPLNKADPEVILKELSAHLDANKTEESKDAFNYGKQLRDKIVLDVPNPKWGLVELHLKSTIPKNLTPEDAPAIVRLQDGSYKLIVKQIDGVKLIKIPDGMSTDSFDTLFREHGTEGWVHLDWANSIMKDVTSKGGHTQWDPLTTKKALKRMIEKLRRNKPTDRCNTGYPVTAMPGSGGAKDHYILTYGKDIRSAWGKEGNSSYPLFSNQTGSSQAAPITTGILILLHQSLYSDPNAKGSWGELLKIVKEKARPIGDPKYFGLGALDTKRLFPEILGISREEQQ